MHAVRHKTATRRNMYDLLVNMRNIFDAIKINEAWSNAGSHL